MVGGGKDSQRSEMFGPGGRSRTQT